MFINFTLPFPLRVFHMPGLVRSSLYITSQGWSCRLCIPENRFPRSSTIVRRPRVTHKINSLSLASFSVLFLV